jgi:hypothetical protein
MVALPGKLYALRKPINRPDSQGNPSFSIGMFGVAALLTRTRLAPTQRGK